MLTRPPTRWFSLVLIAIALLAVATGSVHAQGATPDANTVIPLEGLDPVMLSEGKEVQGDMKYQVTRGRFRYIFANAQTQATFEKDPARYEIQLNGSCARMGAPGQYGQISPAALSQTVKTKSICRASSPANSSQLLERRPSVANPFSPRRASAAGCTFPLGWLPAEKAWNRPAPLRLRIASARIERAELPVQRMRTL